MSARKSSWQLCLSKINGTRNKIQLSVKVCHPDWLQSLPRHLDRVHPPVADVEEFVLAWPEARHQRRAPLRVLPTIEAVELRRHPVEIVIRVPGTDDGQGIADLSWFLIHSLNLNKVTWNIQYNFINITFSQSCLIFTKSQEDFKVRGWAHRDNKIQFYDKINANDDRKM